MSKTRLEAFTDAVIAITMTILVLALIEPEEPTLAALWSMRYKFLIYILSFVSLAIYWNNHHHLLQISKVVNGRVLWNNMAFILCLTFFPFATAWVDENLFDIVPEITYGVVMLLTHAAYLGLEHALVKVNGEESKVAKAMCNYRKSKITLIIIAIGIVIGLFIPIAVVIFIVISLMLWVIPDSRIEKILFGKNETCNKSNNELLPK